MLPSRGQQDHAIILAVARAFGAAAGSRPVTCLVDAGGAAPFLRAYVATPELFAPHHLLVNPVTSQVPAELKGVMEKHGASFRMVWPHV